MLLHRYSFNDGTASDSVGGSAYAGSLMAGATVTNNQATFATSGPYVSLPSGLFGNHTQFTVEAWVTTGYNDQNTWPRIFQFGAAPGADANSVAVFLCSSGYHCTYPDLALQWVDGTGTGYQGGTGVYFNNQVNMHVVLTVSLGDYVKLYINGQRDGTTTARVTSLPPASTFYIGKAFGDSSNTPFSGLIGSVDEIRLWSGALSAADVAANYALGASKRFNSIIIWTSFINKPV